MKADAAFQRRVMRVFEDMLDQPPLERDAWLDQTWGDEPAIRDAVRSMAEASRASHFLPTSPPEPRRTGDDEAMPERISQYHIIRELGRGGMGVVYLGERDDGLFEHKVAIKLMRRTLLSESAMARFATERRILARLRHPHIAQMLDGGLTPSGGSYIVMELIAGQPITEYCTERGLDMAGRLALFREVGNAIEHAHRNLVVHADIKPSNVVVEDGFGVKLLDFGIARLLDDTDDGQHQGYTIGYASPARIEGLPATPADDIYAATKLLSELIKNQPGLDDDLRAVVAKGAASDPAQRYGSVRELLDDLGRWQAYRPTRAANPGRTRRAELYWRRHRLGLSLGAIAALAIIIAFITISTLYVRSERQRQLANQRYAATRQMADYVIGNVDPALARVPGTLALRKQLVEQTGVYLRNLEANRASPASLKREIASGYLRMARIYGLDPSGGIGDLAAAKASLAHGEQLIDQATAQEPGAPQLLLLRAQADLLKGSEVFVAPSRAAAENGLASFQQAQSLFKAYLRHDPNNVSARLGLWGAQSMPARDLNYLGKPLEGVAPIVAHLDNANMSVDTPAERAERDFYLSGSYLLLGEAYASSDPAKAVQYFTQLIAHVDRMQLDGRSDWEDDLTKASGLTERGLMKDKLGDTAGAIADEERSVAELQHLYLVESNHEMGVYLAHVRGDLAELQAKAGRYVQARRSSDESIVWLRHDAEAAPQEGARVRTLAMALTSRAKLEQQAGDMTSACRFGDEAVRTWSNASRARAEMPMDTEPTGSSAIAAKTAATCRKS